MRPLKKIFVDTSAFYALLDRSDPHYIDASTFWPDLLQDHITLVTSNYVIGETTSLLQSRISFEAARLWYRDILGIMEIEWVNPEIHQRAYELWLNLGSRHISLVDCVSFVVMLQKEIEAVFCFKSHFIDHGFALVDAKKL